MAGKVESFLFRPKGSKISGALTFEEIWTLVIEHARDSSKTLPKRGRPGLQSSWNT
jgi:hypothetical protein